MKNKEPAMSFIRKNGIKRHVNGICTKSHQLIFPRRICFALSSKSEKDTVVSARAPPDKNLPVINRKFAVKIQPKSQQDIFC